ncbi:MAG: methyltransferase [Pseudomonadota bacterium]
MIKSEFGIDNVVQIEQRLVKLDRLMVQCEWLWRPQPYKQVRPAWCEQLPELCVSLLGLSDQQLADFSGDGAALNLMLSEHISELSQLPALTHISECELTQLDDLGPHFNSGIPGRKWQQIEKFAAALGPVDSPLLEWCGGKGHLGRLLAAQWQTPVLTIEHNDELCIEGEHFAKRAKVKQRFRRVDALSAEAGREVGGHHAVALHACGELHRSLLREAVKSGIEAFDIAPCCYYVGAGEKYHAFNDSLQLSLSRDDLRLAVTETVTAAGREVVKRDREMAWKLGYQELCREQCHVEAYLPIKPIDKKWLKLGFEGFCRKLAEREERVLSIGIDWVHYEELGWLRQGEVMRLSLVRAAFRRGLEMWLVLDMANYIAANGYRVQLATFCNRDLTPRNILISARRRSRHQ